MLRLYRRKHCKYQQYTPSAQTHCQTEAVEAWMLQDADAGGRIHNVHIEMHGTRIAVAHASEVRVVAALYAADHNDYVTLNLCYAMDTSPAPELERHEVDMDSASDTEQHIALCKLDDDFEQNETLIVNDFGPSHARDTDW
jgi:hypothetical protein